MGIKLVTDVQVHVWPKLGRRHDLAARVLMVMARTALDDDRIPTYFAGSKTLALACGYDPEDTTGARAVRRALSQLQRLGYVEQMHGQPRHHNRRWMLKIPGEKLRIVPSATETTSPQTKASGAVS